MQKSIYPGASGASIISQSEVDVNVKFGRSPHLGREKRSVTRLSEQSGLEAIGSILTRLEFTQKRSVTGKEGGKG